MTIAATLRSLMGLKEAASTSPAAMKMPQKPVPRVATVAAKPAPAGTQITISLPVELSQWMRSYAHNNRMNRSDVAAAAIIHAMARPAPAQYSEPGTSVTHMGVAEVELTLTSAHAKWLLSRAAQDRVSHCAVFHAAVSSYREVAPVDEDKPRRLYITGQELYYKHIAGVYEDAADGKLSAEEADHRLAHAVAVRLYDLLPHVERDEVRAAAEAAIRELCMNHPALRQAHGREKAPLTTAARDDNNAPLNGERQR